MQGVCHLQKSSARRKKSCCNVDKQKCTVWWCTASSAWSVEAANGGNLTLVHTLCPTLCAHFVWCTLVHTLCPSPCCAYRSQLPPYPMLSYQKTSSDHIIKYCSANSHSDQTFVVDYLEMWCKISWKKVLSEQMISQKTSHTS